MDEPTSSLSEAETSALTLGMVMPWLAAVVAALVAITDSTPTTLFGSGRLFGILSWLIWSVWC